MSSNLLFTVIIPTYHRNDSLAKCLDCLAQSVQTLPADKYEVIVTDDGSETTGEEMLRQYYPWAKWVSGPRKGPAANRNNGVRYAEGEWLAFTDDDCLPDPQWLEVYANAIANHPSYLVFEGRTYVDRPRKSLAEISPVNETGGYLWSCNFVIKAKVFKSLGCFNELFPYATMEDVELRYRLNKVNYDFFFVSSASVCHPWRYKGGWQKLRQHEESVLIYLYLHPEELKKINYKLYLWQILRGIIKDTIPIVIEYKCLGIKETLLEYVHYMRMSFILLYIQLKRGLNHIRNRAETQN